MPLARALIFACLAGPALAQEPAPGPPAGAASCTGCHGLFAGASFPIHELPADEIAAALAGFRDGSREGTLMPRIAAGFSEQESRAVAEWFAARDTAE